MVNKLKQTGGKRYPMFYSLYLVLSMDQYPAFLAYSCWWNDDNKCFVDVFFPPQKIPHHSGLALLLKRFIERFNRIHRDIDTYTYTYTHMHIQTHVRDKYRDT